MSRADFEAGFAAAREAAAMTVQSTTSIPTRAVRVLREKIRALLPPATAATAKPATPTCPVNCPLCSGEACAKCGAGLWRAPTRDGNACEHDSAQRHEEPDDEPPAATAKRLLRDETGSLRRCSVCGNLVPSCICPQPAATSAAPCGGTRCFQAGDGIWIHSSKGSCSVRHPPQIRDGWSHAAPGVDCAASSDGEVCRDEACPLRSKRFPWTRDGEVCPRIGARKAAPR